VLKQALLRSELHLIVLSTLADVLSSYTVHLAPVFPSLAEPELNFSLPFLSYDPRCLKRDVSVWVSSNWTKDSDSYSLITQNTDIYWFQQIMQGNEFVGGFYGVHTAGEPQISGATHG
jgi:tyrosinase